MLTMRYLTGASVAALAIAATPAFAGDVTGTVIEQSGTVALQSAVVRIPELGRQVVTGRDGSFRIANLPEGSYTIEVSYVGVPTERQTVDVPETGVVTANFALGGDGQAAILVIGQFANQANALSRKYASDTISDVLTRDAIGQFPDQNVAESLRRLPGINVLNDQGEGRFVSVRGLDPSLNATSINGVRVPAPENDTRAVALDVVSSEIIESIEVQKSLTPDLDADTIGASIQINTVSALDRQSNFLIAVAEGSYNEYSEALTPRGSVNFGLLLGENIGLSGGLSYDLREFETDNIEADGWQDEDGLVYAEDLEYRDYNVERERISGSLGLDVRVSDTTDLYVRGLYSQFDDQEFRGRTIFDLADARIAGSGTSVSYADIDPSAPDEEYAITVERDMKDRLESQKIRTVSFGGDTDTGEWTASWMGSWALSSEREDNNVDGTAFARDFEGEGLVTTLDFSNERIPLYAVSGVDDFFDAATYDVDVAELTELSDAEDEEYAARFDIGREFAMDQGTFTVQAGGKGRWREKRFNGEIKIYERDDYTLADVVGEQSFRLADIAPVASGTGHSEFFFANRSSFELIEADSAFDSAVEDYSIEEDIYAAYGLARWDSDQLTVIGGVRYERTINHINGNNVLLVEEDGTLPTGQAAEEDTVIVTPTTTSKRYNFWAPSLNIRYEPVNDVVLRAAGYRSLVRPNFAQLAPRFATEQNDGDDIEGEFGNPDLTPYKAWNFDLSAEYYFSGNGALSAAFFYKDLQDYIVNVEYEADGERLVFRDIAFDEAVIPLNGESATIWGIELGFAQQWGMLPAPFDGIITQANYTYTDAEGDVPASGSGTLGQVTETRTIPLPATSKHTFNGVLGYEKGPVSFRLAGTYRDDFLDELSGSPEEDRLVDSHFQLDATLRLNLTENLQVFAQAVNINDAEFFAYNTVGGRQNAYQFERYGRTFRGGVRVSF